MHARAPPPGRLFGSPGVPLPAPVRVMLAQRMNATSIARPGGLAPPPSNAAELVHAEHPVPGVAAVGSGPNVRREHDGSVGCADKALQLVATTLVATAVL